MLDAVIVGSGPNGLVAAVTLAAAGKRVLVLEAAATIGGGARTAELTLPGFHHDVCSSVHPLTASSPALIALALADLTWSQPPIPMAHPLDGGGAAVLLSDPAATAQRLGADGDAYRRTFGSVARHWEHSVRLRSVPRSPHSDIRSRGHGSGASRCSPLRGSRDASRPILAAPPGRRSRCSRCGAAHADRHCRGGSHSRSRRTCGGLAVRNRRIGFDRGRTRLPPQIARRRDPHPHGGAGLVGHSRSAHRDL